MPERKPATGPGAANLCRESGRGGYVSDASPGLHALRWFQVPKIYKSAMGTLPPHHSAEYSVLVSSRRHCASVAHDALNCEIFPGSACRSFLAAPGSFDYSISSALPVTLTRPSLGTATLINDGLPTSAPCSTVSTAGNAMCLPARR